MRNSNFAIILLFGFLTIFGAMIWNLNGTYYADDYYYSTIASAKDDYECGRNETIRTFSQAIESVKAHAVYCNGRLSNFIHILFQPLPRSLEAIFLSACILLLWLMLQYASQIPPKALGWSAMLASILMWTSLPWHDSMQSLDFQMNYVLPSAAVLSVIALSARADKLTVAAFAASAVLAFLTGWLNEAFSVILLVYLGCALILNIRAQRTLIIFICVAAGLTADMYFGTYRRASAQLGDIAYPPAIYMRQFLIRASLEAWPVYLAWFLAVIRYFTLGAGLRKTFVHRALPWLAAVSAGFCMSVVAFQAGRVLWPACLFAAAFIVYILSDILSKLKRGISLPIAIVLACVYSWWFLGLIQWQIRDSYERGKVAAYLLPRKAHFSSIVYADISAPDACPWYLMDIPSQKLFVPDENCFMYSYFDTNFGYMAILPEAMQERSLTDLPVYDGNAHIHGRYPSLLHSDSTICELRFTFGPPDGNMPPFDRLLSAIRHRSDTVSSVLPYWQCRHRMPDGEFVWAVNLDHVPRTLRHRPLLRIDTLCHENQ